MHSLHNNDDDFKKILDAYYEANIELVIEPLLDFEVLNYDVSTD